MEHAQKLTQTIAALTAAPGSGKDGGALAEAYFKRAVCHYLLGKPRLAASDLNAAGLLGCQDALLWSRYDVRQNAKTG